LGFDILGNLVFGTLLTIVVLVFLALVARGAKRRLFPSENEEERSEAMTELLLLQAKLQERAKNAPVSKEPNDGDEDEPGLNG
jgi:hypothetical protein